MTRWKRNRVLKAEKMAVENADKETNDTNYIRNVFKKISNKIAEIIRKFRK